MSNSNKGERNTGYEFDLVDPKKAQRGENGIMKNFMAQMGNFDTRHEAIGMKARIESRYPELDYEVRAFETMWREVDEPTVCEYCGYEDWYLPLVRWHFTDDGTFCTEQCKARYEYENHD